MELLAAKAGSPVALRYRRDLERLMERLAAFPTSGSPRPKLGAQTRIGVLSPYVLIYDLRADTVRVLRILDGRRNIRAGVLPP